MQKAAEIIRSAGAIAPRIGLILGSGLGDYAEQIEQPVVVPYRDIEGFPVSGVEGHASRFVVGRCKGQNVIAMQGRFHFYEGPIASRRLRCLSA